MEKRQVSKILLIETLLIDFFALIAGLIAGVFLSQGLAMLTAKMFAVQMKEFPKQRVGKPKPKHLSQTLSKYPDHSIRDFKSQVSLTQITPLHVKRLFGL